MNGLSLLLLLSAGFAASGQFCSNLRSSDAPKCIPVGGTVCGSYYSHGVFPNSISKDLNDSTLSINQYFMQLDTLIGSCSLGPYLCLAFMPPCDPNQVPVRGMGPCQSNCEEVKSGCSSISDFIVADANFNCLFAECSRYSTSNCSSRNESLQLSIATINPTPPSNNSAPSVCPLPNNTFFSSSSKSFALGWTSFWSVLCFLSTLLTLLTFFLDTSRFEYPWRPVIYLALMFNIHSVAYFFSAALGRGLVTCPGGEFVTVGTSWSWAHTPCLLVFIVLYYTMLAAFLWWVVLALGWFLVSAWQWSHEAVGKMTVFFHVSCWVIPLLMTVAVLSARVVGADEATGVCFLVRDASSASFYGLLVGLIVPLLLLLAVGVVLLLLGFLGVLKVRAHMQRGGKQEEQQILEKLMVRIGIYVAIYIVPAAIMIGCYFYELVARPSWRPLSDDCTSCGRANSAVFMVRVLMFLLVGVMTGVWIWSRKTFQSWLDLLGRCGMMVGHVPSSGREEVEFPATASNHTMTHQPTKDYSYADSGLESL